MIRSAVFCGAALSLIVVGVTALKGGALQQIDSTAMFRRS